MTPPAARALSPPRCLRELWRRCAYWGGGCTVTRFFDGVDAVRRSAEGARLIFCRYPHRCSCRSPRRTLSLPPLPEQSMLPRKSKVRHVFHQPVKADETYTAIKPTNKSGPHQFIKANTKYFALSEQAGGGGPLLVRSFAQTGKLPTAHHKITGHTAAVFDFDWNPFHEQLLAAGDEAAELMLWGIPDGPDGLTEDLHTPLQKFPGHRKKISFVLFNPCAENVIASASWDLTVKIWDMQTAANKFTIADAHKKPITDLKWNYDGSILATTCQDKKSRFFDPRASTQLIAEFQAHKGGKPSKNCFLGSKQMMVTVGFTKQSKREFKFWVRHHTRERVLFFFRVRDCDRVSPFCIAFCESFSPPVF